MNLLIAGGTGLVGREIIRLLRADSTVRDIRVLSRNAQRNPWENAGVRMFEWDPLKGKIDPEAANELDGLIVLAGESVGSGRWTPERKREILDSRVRANELLSDALKKSGARPAIVSASAIGYYGETGESIATEDSKCGSDFLSQTTHTWEQSSMELGTLGKSSAIVRVGVVLSTRGGALEKMVTPIKMLVGAPLGTGKQFISWIHIEDLARIFLKLLSQNSTGIYNGVSPGAVTNSEFMHSIASVLNKPMFLPNVPATVLKLALGEMADIVLIGVRVEPTRLLTENFDFKFINLESTLRNLLL